VLKNMGLDKNPRPLPSLLLGALALSPIEVSQLYQTIAAQGFYSPIKTIQSVLNQDALVLTRYPFEIEKRFSTQSMLALQGAMQSVVRRGTARSASQWLPPALNAAGKTGTTDQQRDSWFAGYTQDYLSVVWLGRDDNASTQLTGSNGALRVWSQLMSHHAKLPIQQVLPSNMTQLWIDGNDGLVTDESCENAHYVVLLKDQVPKERSRCGRQKGIRGWFDRIF